MVLQWYRCVLKSPWLCRLGDASYVMCTALYMMVLYDRARVGPTTKISDKISIICLFRLILQANPLFLNCGIRVSSKSSVDSIPSLNGVLMFLCEYQSFLIIEIVFPILFNRCVSLQVNLIVFNICKINYQFFSTLFVHQGRYNDSDRFPSLEP